MLDEIIFYVFLGFIGVIGVWLIVANAKDGHK